MGAVCSAGTMEPRVDFQERSSGFSGKLNPIRSFSKHKKNSYSDPGLEHFEGSQTYDSGDILYSISRELKSSTPARSVPNKAPQRGSFLKKAGIVGFERAVEVLDTLGSGVSNLNSGSGFVSGMASRGNRICILAFEIANTITKGANLMHSLSEENVQFLKKEVLHSQGVQKLVSTDLKELGSIAAADKREELDLFSREVIRFGDLCKDPQWHNLGRLFSKLDLEHAVSKQQREETDMTMQELITLAQHTAELYHELNSLDRFEQDYRRKLEEVESLNLPRKGEGVMMMCSEVKHQRKLVRSLKKKSLWAKSLEEVVEKLVDIVIFIYQEIMEAFDDGGVKNLAEGSTLVSKESVKNTARLGVAGLALHYANVINQIDNVASRPSYLPPTIRDQLYHGLPDSVKVALRSRCLSLDAKEELTLPQIRAEMEKTLHWLVPVATNTTKVHQGFGWVGEWANTGSESSKKGSEKVIRLQTLYHADKQKTDFYILELLTWLHRLVGITTHSTIRIRPLHTRSPTKMDLKLKPFQIDYHNEIGGLQFSTEDKNLLEKVINQKMISPGISKSQEFSLAKKKGTKFWACSRSTGSSPRRRLGPPKGSFLDVMDGLDSAF